MSRRTLLVLLGGLLFTVLAHLAIAGIFSGSASADRAGAADTAVDPNAACSSDELAQEEAQQETDEGASLSTEELNDPLRGRA